LPIDESPKDFIPTVAVSITLLLMAGASGDETGREQKKIPHFSG
jgi:hypothetical protein